MPQQNDIQKLITQHQRRLQKLRERQAKQGISTPPEVLTEIEDIEAQIDRLRAELEIEQTTLRQTLKSLSPTTPVRQPVEERLAAIEQHLQQVAAVFDQRGQPVGRPATGEPGVAGFAPRVRFLLDHWGKRLPARQRDHRLRTVQHFHGKGAVVLRVESPDGSQRGVVLLRIARPLGAVVDPQAARPAG